MTDMEEDETTPEAQPIRSVFELMTPTLMPSMEGEEVPVMELPQFVRSPVVVQVTDLQEFVEGHFMPLFFHY